MSMPDWPYCSAWMDPLTLKSSFAPQKQLHPRYEQSHIKVSHSSSKMRKLLWTRFVCVLVLSYCLCVRQEGFANRPAFEIACREHICKHEQGFFLPKLFRALHLQPVSIPSVSSSSTNRVLQTFHRARRAWNTKSRSHQLCSLY